MVTQLGRFSVESEIGRGAMGVVYKGTHPGLGLPVAIKVLTETFSQDASFRHRFQREAATIASLNHPGIVRVYDFDEDQGSLFIVMEYVEGRPLRSYLQQYVRFTVETSLDLIEQMLSAAGAAHAKGIVHRDLKPENVLISAQGKTKILDFGVSKLVGDEAHLTATGSMVGTPYYMSPEQVRGEVVDSRSDIYSLGAMLYELMHGEPPFVGTMAAVLHSQAYETPRPSTAIPPPLMQLIYKSMAKDPGARFRSCEEFAGALLALPKAAQVIDPPTAPPIPPTPPPPRTNFKIRFPGSRRKAAKEDLEAGGCTYAGCPAREGWPCGYTDPTGNRCDTWWCKDHIVFLENMPFCPRHANVLRALSTTAGTIREIKVLPSVHDRSLPLAHMVAEDVDKDLTELLRRRYQGRPDVNVSADPAVRQNWVTRADLAWERNWSAVQHQGFLTRITLRVTTQQPDVVTVVIGNNIVFNEVPDWIARRRDGGPPDEADRARFAARIVEAVMDKVDNPTAQPEAAQPPSRSSIAVPEEITPVVSQELLEGMILRLFATSTRLTGYEVADRLSLPYASVRMAVEALIAHDMLDPHGLAGDGPWRTRPLPERMAYAITNRGRGHAESVGDAGTRYVGPAPVSLDEYRHAVIEAALPVQLGQTQVTTALEGLELAPGVSESIRAAVNSRASLFLYGPPGNGKTSLAHRLVQLLGGPILIPVAIDLDGDVMRVFDASVHRLTGPQPADRRWRLVSRPMVQVGGEFALEMLDPTFEPGSRTYEAPLQVKANGGVLLIDDLGRQRVTPKQILDRLILPLEQGVDFMNLTATGGRSEVPFVPLLTLSTNLKPADLLDEAYLRRLTYKVIMPDPDRDAFGRIFEHECRRLGIPSNPWMLDLIRDLYGDRPMRGSHPRDLLERLTDVAAARGVPPELTRELVEAAWSSIFVAP